MEIDWLKDARAFKAAAGRRLKGAAFSLLELQEGTAHHRIPTTTVARLQEIPCVHRVQDRYRGESGFTYFMDGVQRTALWQHYDYDGFQVPIYLHLSGAVILERALGRFRPFMTRLCSSVLVPTFVYEILDSTEGVEDTGAKDPWDMNHIGWRAKARSTAMRQELEEELVEEFLREDPGGYMVKDGGIPPSVKSDKIVGLVKTHDTLYLQEQLPRLQQMVWAMPEFYRSSSFLLRSEKGEVFSFYLRIHQPADPETGLLRVEYARRDADLDLISRWVIAERSVRAHCSRWDRQIYPVQLCEEYLRSRMPRASNLPYHLQGLEVPA